MTGKKKPVPMYKIQRQLADEQKEVIPCPDDAFKLKKIKKDC